MPSKVVAIFMPEGVEVHLPDATGNYATLCGLDGADEHGSVKQKVVPVLPGQKVDCQRCKAIWEVARRYRASDFK